MIEYQFKPLTQWPGKRTQNRRRATFAVGLSRTWNDLDRELRHLGLEGWRSDRSNIVVIEAGFREQDIRNDGKIRANAPKPSHPGVILSFTALVNKARVPMRFDCDTFTEWEHNVRAISLTLTALRAVERYGATKSGQQYTGWKALPGPLITPASMTVEEAAKAVARLHGEALPSQGQIITSADAWRTGYRMAAAQWHPDKHGGQQLAEWAHLQDAAEVLRRHHGA